MDLHVGAVQRAQGDRAVEHELHVAGAAGLLAGQGNLLGDVAGGDELLRPGDVVVLHHVHLHPGAHVGVVGNQILQAQDEVDDVLGDGVGRGRLGSKQQGDGPRGPVPRLDLPVLPDDVQGVHLLALVLVQPLDLDVEDGILLQRHTLPLLEGLAQGPLLLLLDGKQLLQGRCVVLVGQQPFQLGGVLLPARADFPRDPLAQLRVAVQQPPAEGDAVCLVVELLRVQLGKGLQLGLLQNLRVQAGHAVDREAVVDVQVGHVHQVVFI